MSAALPDAEALLPRLAAELRPRLTASSAMIGLSFIPYAGCGWLPLPSDDEVSLL
jgi:hypothetical protein